MYWRSFAKPVSGDDCGVAIAVEGSGEGVVLEFDGALAQPKENTDKHKTKPGISSRLQSITN